MARRFRPLHGLLLVPLFMAAVLVADYTLSGGLGRDFERVTPEAGQEEIRIDVSALGPAQVRFFRYLNRGNQEVKFLIGRDPMGRLQVAFDAAESDYKRKRGFRHEGEWLVNNKCDTAVRLAEVHEGAGGCRPVPLRYRTEGGVVVLHDRDILTGWRYFR
ncbi:MAG TPA: Fe-S-containing protein [Thermoanaerobaculia bacterium]|nr:Fe-S-containing protein [Thermoanaerobaculia bacterium]